jgi:hypothetical protein
MGNFRMKDKITQTCKSNPSKLEVSVDKLYYHCKQWVPEPSTVDKAITRGVNQGAPLKSISKWPWCLIQMRLHFAKVLYKCEFF